MSRGSRTGAKYMEKRFDGLERMLNQQQVIHGLAGRVLPRKPRASHCRHSPRIQNRASRCDQQFI
jgi:hypothetical protein